MNEWDDTPWAGSVPLERSLVIPDSPVIKAETGPFVSHVQYGQYLMGRDRTPQALMRRAQASYHQHPWVGSAEATVTRRVAGLPWHLEDENDEEYEEPYPSPVQAAYTLLEKPQAALPPEMRDPGLLTRRALISITSRHLGLCGMAYWYLDQPDLNGLPLAILYVNPARVWPSTTANGRVVGWVIDAQDEYGHGGTPLELSDLLPFYLDPPDHGPYGTGLYERGLVKAQLTDQTDRHWGGVLGSGGRLAGILSPKEGTIPKEEYETLVREFRNVNEAPDSAKRATILRGPIDFTQTAGNPDQLDIVEFAKMNRDDIFAVWGVPPRMAGIPSAGGLNSGETAKQDEAILMQGPVHDRVMAIKEPVQFGLLDRWLNVGTTIDLEIEEPSFDDEAPMYEIASKALNIPLTNAERRELVGKQPFGDARDDEVWLPALLQPAYTSTNGPQLPVPLPSTPPVLPIPAKASKREFLGLRRSVDTRWVPAVRKPVAEYLASQRSQIAAKVRAASPGTIARQRKNPQAWLDTETETERLRKLLAPVLGSLAETVGDRVGSLLKDRKADPFTESVVARLLKKVGERIRGITRTTQEAVQSAIERGYDEGLSPGQIADLIEGLPAFDESRAELVARTETMFAYNDAALASYDELGVTDVEAIDGDDDEECATRDGQTYTIEEAADIEDHPNGTLDWLPVLGKAQDPMLALIATIASQKADTHVQVVVPDTLSIPVPIVHVAAPEVHVNQPDIHVAAPAVTIEARPPMRTVIDYDGDKVIGEHEEPV